MSALLSSPVIPKGKDLRCLNGPCENTYVNGPYDAMAGQACAVPWTGPKGKRFAVYLAVEHAGALGLMYMQSYTDPSHAAAKVRELTAICAAGVLDDLAAKEGD